MKVFISACKGNSNDKKNTDMLFKTLRMLEFKDITYVEGCYKGQVEDSFMVKLDGSVDNGFIKLVELGEQFDQESIMLVCKDNNAHIVYMSGSVESIGKLKEVDSIEGLDAYSRIDGKYFSVV